MLKGLDLHSLKPLLQTERCSDSSRIWTLRFVCSTHCCAEKSFARKQPKEHLSALHHLETGAVSPHSIFFSTGEKTRGGLGRRFVTVTSSATASAQDEALHPSLTLHRGWRQNLSSAFCLCQHCPAHGLLSTSHKPWNGCRCNGWGGQGNDMSLKTQAAPSPTALRMGDNQPHGTG